MEKIQLGIVKEVCSADKSSSGLPRPLVETLILKEGYGIEQDKFAGGDLEKTVMIIGTHSYDMAKAHGMDLKPGSYGENILFDFDPHELDVTNRLKVGDAIIEITQKCTLCNHLSVFGAKLPKLIKNHRGLYCKIIKGGVITRGSVAYKISM
ncbi:MOSC domain-containing protein [Sulfurospirillum sp. 1612]|uniref:MOSC domain-containing protein n=1 Tax=Sulfurospirillum sp. 1612 TaxID=3094835 RepID=UPI002F9570C5